MRSANLPDMVEALHLPRRVAFLLLVYSLLVSRFHCSSKTGPFTATVCLLKQSSQRGQAIRAPDLYSGPSPALGPVARNMVSANPG